MRHDAARRHTRRYGRAGLALVVALGGVGTALALGQVAPVAPLRTIPLQAGQQPTFLALDARRGHAFVGIDGGNTTRAPAALLMLDTATGAPLATIPLAGTPANLVVDARQRRVFVAETTGALAVIDAGTGRTLRTIPVPAPRGWTDPTPAPIGWLYDDALHRRVWVASPDEGYGGALSAFDAATGRQIGVWPIVASPLAMTMDARTRHALVLSAGVTGAPGGAAATYLSVLDAVSGRLLHRASLPGSSAFGFVGDGAEGRAYVVCGASTPSAPGRVVVVDPGTGRVLRVVTLRQEPLALAVDPGTGHAFVAESSPVTIRQAPGGRGATFPTAPGTVIMLDGQGRVVRAVGVGLALAALALAAPHHRLIVTNAGARDAYLTAGMSSYVVRAPAPGPSGMRLLDTRTGAVERTIDAGVSSATVAVDAVIGIVKEVLGFRQFSPPGLQAAAGEWCLVCLAFNLKRLHTLLQGEARRLGGLSDPCAGADPAVGSGSVVSTAMSRLWRVVTRHRSHWSGRRAWSCWPSPCVFSPTSC